MKKTKMRERERKTENSKKHKQQKKTEVDYMQDDIATDYPPHTSTTMLYTTHTCQSSIENDNISISTSMYRHSNH